MKKNIDMKDWNKQKAEELFSLSHQMLDVAKQLGEYHANELRIHVNHAIELVKHSAKSDLRKLEEIQKDAATEAAIRINTYQKDARKLLDQLSHEVSTHSEKHIQHAMHTLADWLEEGDKKMPVGAEKLANVVRDFSQAGSHAYKEGRKLVSDAIDNADQALNKITGAELIVPSSTSKSSKVKKPVN